MEESHIRDPPRKCPGANTFPHIYKWYARGLKLLYQTIRRWCKALFTNQRRKWQDQDASWSKNAEEWAKIWKMFFHIKKCKYLHIGKNLPDTQYIMSVDQNPTEVTQVTTEKDLGVIFDEQLIYRDHISKKAALANRNLGLIFRSFTYIDKAMFLNLYKSLVRPHLE